MVIKNFINIIIIFLIITGLGYLLGLSITNVVDQRLSDISINLPKINLPKQTIHVNLDMETIQNHRKDKPISVKINNEFNSNQSDQGPSFELNPPKSSIKPLSNQSKDKLSEGFKSEIMNDPKETGENKTPLLVSPLAVYSYGPTYYKDPKNMTIRQLDKFKRKAKLNNMTLQDYVNWLQLFNADSSQLNAIHRQNLIKLQKGIRLIISDLPKSATHEKLASNDYNEQIYELEA